MPENGLTNSRWRKGVDKWLPKLIISGFDYLIQFTAILGNLC